MTDTSSTNLGPQADALQAAINEATRELHNRERAYWDIWERARKNPQDDELQQQSAQLWQVRKEAQQKVAALTEQLHALETNTLAAVQKALVERASREDASQYADFSEKELNAAREYLDVASGAIYPKGTFHGGFWEPTEDNCLSCCTALKLPTNIDFRSKTLIAHCKSAKHMALFHGVDRTKMLKAARVLERLEPSLPEIPVETGFKFPPEAQEMTRGGTIVLPSERQLVSGWRMRLIRQADYWVGVFETRLARHTDGGKHEGWVVKQAAKKAVLLDRLGRWKRTRHLLEPGSAYLVDEGTPLTTTALAKSQIPGIYDRDGRSLSILTKLLGVNVVLFERFSDKPFSLTVEGRSFTLPDGTQGKITLEKLDSTLDPCAMVADIAHVALATDGAFATVTLSPVDNSFQMWTASLYASADYLNEVHSTLRGQSLYAVFEHMTDFLETYSEQNAAAKAGADG